MLAQVWTAYGFSREAAELAELCALSRLQPGFFGSPVATMMCASERGPETGWGAPALVSVGRDSHAAQVALGALFEVPSRLDEPPSRARGPAEGGRCASIRSPGTS